MSYDFGSPIMVDLRLLKLCNIDSSRLCEPIGLKNIVLRPVEVEIINVHVFTHQPGVVYYVLHIG